ncbi:helix-turn-helix transcriptional regulator [Oceanobacillus senegalensis]|uniref:helix-turn-helix transcriptional regulator n=1 Tax=Oceanobacillus senegalensis TaxID=1936063 RepID=UPI000A304E40|nr:AraC family transcriptional regulator [Oceanobacillus senegalensis]
MEEKLERISQMIHSITKIDIRWYDYDGNMIYPLINHSIPSVLNQPDNECFHINEVLRKNQRNHYYHYINTYGLEYITVGIWRSNSFHGSIVIGPIITSISVMDLISDIISKNNLPIGKRKQLEEFYQSLPVLSQTECKHIGELLVNMSHHDFMNAQKISSPTLKPAPNQHIRKMDMEGDKQIIENRYEYQNKLMNAITKGNKVEVNHLLHSMSELVAFSDRVPGKPIRSFKNIAFVMNTLSRVAAERSGVHPIYLHNISERFAILIERTTNIPKLKKLMVLMANDYCDLVITFSSGHYSPMIKKAVDYIQLNLGEESLSLHYIAKQIHVNPSHLSRKFKEDTGMTLTEFIQRKRVDEAKLYLQKGNLSVTDIAYMVGFNDLNYFSKVFKKLNNQTPSQYAKERKM